MHLNFQKVCNFLLQFRTENNKKWASESDSVQHSDLVLDAQNYIGVTPGKIYKLKISIWAMAELDPCQSNVSLNIYIILL